MRNFIKDVKEKIYKEKGEDYRPENQKLILLGKVLEDNKTVQELNITENSSIVCFAAKVVKNHFSCFWLAYSSFFF